jgi:hypothetical protein
MMQVEKYAEMLHFSSKLMQMIAWDDFIKSDEHYYHAQTYVVSNQNVSKELCAGTAQE